MPGTLHFLLVNSNSWPVNGPKKAFMNNLIKSKTVWAGIAGLITAAGGFFTEEMDPGVAIQTGIVSLPAIFLRHGIAKQG